VFVVGPAGAILLANKQARALLAERCGALRSERGVLTAARPRDTALLHRAMALAASGSAPWPCALAHHDGALPVVVEVPPVRSPAAFDGPLPEHRLLLLVTDPARDGEPSLASVKAVLGATESKAAAAVRIAKGEAVPAVAATLGVSANTVRTHLNRVFEKTGTRRQAQLAWLLLARLPPR
jgi:DNA-binding CsgD family transcriptional regulator